MKEPYELATESMGELIDSLEGVTKLFEAALVRHGFCMTDVDHQNCWGAVERAQALLKKLSPD